MSNEDENANDRVEFITPPNHLKRKAGSGGLSKDIIEKAQSVLAEKSQSFQPMAELYLSQLKQSIRNFEQDKIDDESLIDDISYYIVQLRAGAGMFDFTLVFNICGLLLSFVDDLENYHEGVVDNKALEVIQAFHASIQAMASGNVSGDAGAQGKALLLALEKTCADYKK